MFTGIITDVGRVRSVKQTDRDRRYEIETAYDLAGVDIGASISHSGCCLTVVEKGEGWFAVEVSGETLTKTTLGAWAAGDPNNLPAGATPAFGRLANVPTASNARFYQDQTSYITVTDPANGQNTP